MKKFLNPHPFDMSNYYLGKVFTLGGKDLEASEKNTVLKKPTPKTPAPKPSWSFGPSIKK